MTHPSIHARNTPNKIAYQMAATGKAITYRELDELSNQGAHLFRKLGLKAGDHIAFLMENRLAFMVHSTPGPVTTLVTISSGSFEPESLIQLCAVPFGSAAMIAVASFTASRNAA